MTPVLLGRTATICLLQEEEEVTTYLFSTV